MRTRILWNDLKGSPLPAVTTWLFMAASAFLFALTCFLAMGLLDSVDTLMEAAQTPDFLQMHAGQMDEAALARFAEEQEQVQAFQTQRFLNLENSSMVLEGHSLSDSTQDNGVCVQSRHFDYLVDLENRVIDNVRSGEIYVPVCYRQKYDLHAGDTVQIGEANFSMKGLGEGVLRESKEQAKIIRNAGRFLTEEAKGASIMPGATDNRRTYNQQSSVSLTGNTFYIRDEQDVKALAIEIAALTRRQQRGKGLRMA